MKEKYKKILTLKRPELVEEIDPESGLINHLESKKVLTRRQAVAICRNPDPFRKNEALLDILYKRPDEDFDKFCDALTECNQSHVVSKYLVTDIPSPVPYSRNVVGDFEGFGVDVRREEPSVSPLRESLQNGSLCLKDQVSGAKARAVPNAVPSGDKRLPMDSAKLIQLEDIVVKQCECDFYDSKKQTAYKMNQVCRGRCLIINISETINQEPRQGAEVDERIVQKLFRELHFDVILRKNLSADDIRSLLADVLSDPCLVGDQCFVLFLMSHGAIEKCGGVQSEVIFGSDGKLVTTSEILEQISNCQALAGKPKLAFFQACRGDNYDASDCKSENHSAEDEEEEDKEDDVTETDANPPGYVNLQDFIVGFPTQSGFRSFRNTKNGSWYLNAIVRVFMEDSHHMDVSAMLRKVNGIVSQWLPNTTDTAMKLKGQIASLTDGLVKPYLYLFPGIISERSSS